MREPCGLSQSAMSAQRSATKRPTAKTKLQPLYDVAAVEALMQSVAKQGKQLSYSEALAHLGYQFSRPIMRALCATLGAVDERAAKRGEPELAVLVTRASDKLPGQGWWLDRHAYQGSWTGPEAVAYIRKLQKRAFTYWGKLQKAHEKR